MESYEAGAGLIPIEHAWRDGLKPDPLLTVSQWQTVADRLHQADREPGV
jgi:hypothetical protein